MNKTFRFAASLLLLAGIAGCEPLGDGSTVERLEIIPASSATQLAPYQQGTTYKLFECFRDELIAVAVFTDGSRSNFSYRARWSSSDTSLVEVSNSDIPAVFTFGTTDGSFNVHPTVKLAPGTVVPHGVSGDTAVVTAEFAGLKASIDLEIRKADLRIVAVPSGATNTLNDTTYLAKDSNQRFTVLANADGRTVTLTELGGGQQNGFTINPFRWFFANGTFEPRVEGVVGDFDKWVAPGSAATLNASTGSVRGVVADYVPHQVVAEQYLCPAADTTQRPVMNAQVVNLYQDPAKPSWERLTLARDALFGTLPDGDMIGTLTQQLTLLGGLDIDNDGDGSPEAKQDFSGQIQYSVAPLNAGCGDQDTFLGCAANDDFAVSVNSQISGVTGFTEGDVTRVQACFPACLPPRATLSASVTGNTADFTATAIDPPPGVDFQYVFDFGDGTTAGPQAAGTASHVYADGAYTATVRLVYTDHPSEFLSQNAGAVRVLANQAVTGTPPTAVLGVTLASGKAPFTATFSAAGSSDADTGDSITVYEFDFGDGSPPVRQTQATTTHVYLDGTNSPFTATVTVYDESGLSGVADAPAVTVTGTVSEIVRSNELEFRARDATLCSIRIEPASATEAAFTFPGVPYRAYGSFVANTDTDTCTDTPIGEQAMTRFMSWAALDSGTDTLSAIAAVRNTTDDFSAIGQVRYLSDVSTDTTLDIAATPIGVFAEATAPARATLTVTPCTGCTP